MTLHQKSTQYMCNQVHSRKKVCVTPQRPFSPVKKDSFSSKDFPELDIWYLEERCRKRIFENPFERELQCLREVRSLLFWGPQISIPYAHHMFFAKFLQETWRSCQVCPKNEKLHLDGSDFFENFRLSSLVNESSVLCMKL